MLLLYCTCLMFLFLGCGFCYSTGEKPLTTCNSASFTVTAHLRHLTFLPIISVEQELRNRKEWCDMFADHALKYKNEKLLISKANDQHLGGCGCVFCLIKLIYKYLVYTVTCWLLKGNFTDLYPALVLVWEVHGVKRPSAFTISLCS